MGYEWPSFVGEWQFLYPDTKAIDEKEIDIMISLCSEDEKADLLILGSALELIENIDLQQKRTTIVIEDQISRFRESDMKERGVRYYERITKRGIDFCIRIHCYQ